MKNLRKGSALTQSHGQTGVEAEASLCGQLRMELSVMPRKKMGPEFASELVQGPVRVICEGGGKQMFGEMLGSIR